MNAWLLVLVLRGAPSEAAGPRRSAPRTPGARVPYGRRSPVLNESIRIAGA